MMEGFEGPGSKASWREEDEEYRVGGARVGGLRSKPRFTFNEVKELLQAVKRNRFIILRKFNHGVSADAKKQVWAEITNQINSLGENHREVRQIMKKWADLKCDGKRRIAAMRGPNGSHIRKKTLGPVERMVHKILMMSPQEGGDSDLDFGEDDDFSRGPLKGAAVPSSYSYLNLTDSAHSVLENLNFDISPMSSPDKDHGSDPFHSSPEFDRTDDRDYMDFDDNDDSLFSSVAPPPSTSLDPLPDGALQRVKPVHTYSRSGQNVSKPGPSSSPSSSTVPAPPEPEAASSTVAPPASQSPPSSPPPPSPVNDGASSSSAPPPPPAASSSSSGPLPPPLNTSPGGSDPLPKPMPSQPVAQLASQSLQQQRASRMLLGSVSQSLEVLAQSVQLLVESQQEFVSESLMLQRQTVDVLREFSATALAMLRDKGAASGQRATLHHHPTSHF